jgi:hypothetical protein
MSTSTPRSISNNKSRIPLNYNSSSSNAVPTTSNQAQLDQIWLTSLSKVEMADLLNKADRLIKSNQSG